MAVTDDYLAFVLEQFARVTPVTARRMFGGVGLYADGVFFGVIDNNQLFLRTRRHPPGTPPAPQVEPGRRATWRLAPLVSTPPFLPNVSLIR